MSKETFSEVKGDYFIDMSSTLEDRDVKIDPIITDFQHHHHNRSSSDVSNACETLLGGRRRKRQHNRIGAGDFLAAGGEADDKDKKVARMWQKIKKYGVAARYFFYVIPFAGVLTIPIVIGKTTDRNPEIGGVDMVHLFSWLEVVWCSFWISRAFARGLPYICRYFIGLITRGGKKYYKIVQAIQNSLQIVLWALIGMVAFKYLIQQPYYNVENKNTVWMPYFWHVLCGLEVCSLLYLGKEVFVQLVALRYHRTQFAPKIKANKEGVRLLAQLYDCSRRLFPDFSREFAEEDRILHLGVGRPRSSYGVVIDTLENADAIEPLARRIWMSFVEEGKFEMYPSDLKEIFVDQEASSTETAADEKAAEDAFAMLDRDKNGDVSLDEMIFLVEETARERKDLTKSIGDVDSTVSDLNSLLSFVIFLPCAFVFFVFIYGNLKDMLSYLGTGMVVASFAFARTIQDLVASIIFIFVKHPYDIGDRVDLSGTEFVVEKISLLTTYFRNVTNNMVTEYPNMLLYSQHIENVSRSRSMLETIRLAIHFKTSFEDIAALRSELEHFVRENNREYKGASVQICGLELKRLDLLISVQIKGNWADQTKRLERRNKFMMALTMALQKVPIYSPGGGDAQLGEGSNPTFTVAITPERAEELRKEAKAAKEVSRLNRSASKYRGGLSAHPDRSWKESGDALSAAAEGTTPIRTPTSGLRRGSSTGGIQHLLYGEAALARIQETEYFEAQGNYEAEEQETTHQRF